MRTLLPYILAGCFLTTLHIFIGQLAKKEKFKTTVLLFPLFFFALGIWTEKTKTLFSMTVLMLALGGLFALLLLSYKTKRYRSSIALFTVLSFFYGALAIDLETSSFSRMQRTIASSNTNAARPAAPAVALREGVNIIGTVCEKTKRKRDFFQESLVLKTDSGRLACYLKWATKIEVGDQIRIQNVKIKYPQHSSFADYLMRKNIAATAFLFRPKFEVISKKRSFARWRNDRREKIYKSLKHKMPKKLFSYFAPIFLGRKRADTPRQNFLYWGIAHHLARSGLHIAIFILIWTLIFALLPLPHLYKNILFLALCSTYAFFSWESLSFLRALILFVLFKTGQMTSKQTNFLHLLQMLTFTLLCLNPIQLFFLDFQLSFGITLALSWFFAR